MATQTRQSQPNLIVALLLVGVVVAGVWLWKRIPLDTRDEIVERGIPLAFAAAAAGAVVLAVVRKLRRRRLVRRRRERLIARFEREPSPEKRLELAFELVELNDYELEGLERVAPAMAELFTRTLQTALGDKQHRIRGMAASHLGVLRDKRAVPLLLKALEDDHAYVRGCAALALGRMRAVEAKEKLAEVAKEDWDQTVRSRAREALERLG
ncbi:HEAT repeat domain-containing protein [Nitrospira sp. Kam-Ns4a]